jgi:hypothetical protein
VGLAVSLSWDWKRLLLLMKLEIKNQSDDHICQRNGLVKDSMMVKLSSSSSTLEGMSVMNKIK